MLNLNTNTVPVAAHRNLFPNISNINPFASMNSPLITQPVFVPFETVPFGAFSSPFPVIPTLLNSCFINPFSDLMNSPLPVSLSQLQSTIVESQTIPNSPLDLNSTITESKTIPNTPIVGLYPFFNPFDYLMNSLRPQTISILPKPTSDPDPVNTTDPMVE